MRGVAPRSSLRTLGNSAAFESVSVRVRKPGEGLRNVPLAILTLRRPMPKESTHKSNHSLSREIEHARTQQIACVLRERHASLWLCATGPGLNVVDDDPSGLLALFCSASCCRVRLMLSFLACAFGGGSSNAAGAAAADDEEEQEGVAVWLCGSGLARLESAGLRDDDAEALELAKSDEDELDSSMRVL